MDGQPRFTVVEPPDWDQEVGSEGGANYDVSTQVPPGAPLVLYHRRFMVRTTPTSSTVPKEPCPGILLWIDREPPARTGAE